jgi:hypothetical protein
MRDCFYCGVPTKNAKYCSRKCAITINNKTPKRKLSPRFCTTCKATLPIERHRRRRCVECTPDPNRAGATTLAELMSKPGFVGRPKSYIHSYVRNHCRSLYRDLTKGNCKVCGYDLHVELCHIKSISSYPLSATVNEINARDNIIPLCPNHHWELDNGRLNFD